MASEDEQVVSLDEYLEAEKDLEEDARAVLGGSDANNCTYDKGYLTRQALYACSTCTGTEQEPAGVCLACSLECHDGHDLYELYTKRKFRCDCGNKKFASTCKLTSEKDDYNLSNIYNQNFRGLYCECKRPYPDPEPDHEENGEMIQCCICEDWYHDNHLELSAPVPEDYEEMICIGCVKKYNFLLYYTKKQTSTSNVTPSKEEDLNQESISVTTELTEERSRSEETEKSSKSCPKLDPSHGQPVSTLFMLKAWREDLCRCPQCLDVYKEHKLEFLLDPEDPINVYEQKSAASSDDATVYDRAVGAMSSLGRVQQIELIQGYNDMKSSLSEYLKRFAANGKVVRSEDIQEFFEEYKKNKRLRSGVPPASCS